MPELLSPEGLVGVVIAAALALYALTGGADFGGGVLDLTAPGPRGAPLRALIRDTIGPIWEANHVWLILVVVVCFVGLPGAFAAIMTTLHLPLLLTLVGVVGRGCAFVFRAYDSPDEATQHTWDRVFAWSSLFTPMALGTTLGALASGAASGPPSWGGAWLAPFPLCVGALFTATVTWLAAVYLCNETSNTTLHQMLQRRGWVAGGLTGLLAALSLLLAREGAPDLWEGLITSPWAPMFHGVTAVFAVGALGAFTRRRWALARALAAGQVVCVTLGWALAQWPLAVPPDLTILEAAAPRSVIVPMLWALGLGVLGLFPALGLLYRVFHQDREG